MQDKIIYLCFPGEILDSIFDSASMARYLLMNLIQVILLIG